MKKLLLFVFLLISLSTFAQNWAPIGATWDFSYEDLHPFKTFHHRLTSVKDTSFLGKNCRKLENSYSGPVTQFAKWASVFMYDSANMVYYALPDSSRWCLIYDFNKNQGDTIFHPCWDFDTLKAISIIDTSYSISINNEVRKVQRAWKHINTPGGNPWVDIFGGDIIEGIGSTDIFFPRNHNGPDDFTFRCYSDSIIGSFKKSSWIYSCDTTLTLDLANEKRNTIDIYPNPSNSELHISGFTYESKIKILDTHGKVHSEEVVNPNEAIDISELPNGIYFIEVINENKIVRKKFVKSD